jgi:hypothetical protein
LIFAAKARNDTKPIRSSPDKRSPLNFPRLCMVRFSFCIVAAARHFDRAWLGAEPVGRFAVLGGEVRQKYPEPSVLDFE